MSDTSGRETRKVDKNRQRTHVYDILYVSTERRRGFLRTRTTTVFPYTPRGPFGRDVRRSIGSRHTRPLLKYLLHRKRGLKLHLP